ncbi:PspC domain-containing protein [Zunongwangia endophytica]|uniref:PspC domain-containing protein n=1 Tax=Zunongwangia endophytica TaxID=1808945 RepID=A0ABV8HAY3_9FLAO|nr:PspC domain-containing protein [Zunongwangia endophytica]MDN3593776.1 PspC domain-containing protein [Zunongwangia endophytica]
MNKTININLAGMFFHIDEDAFNKLQHYLDAIKRSFTDKQGRDEIIMDIEARVAELFTEKRANKSQVISLKDVDEVIAIMGQPEDYMVDEDIFEDEPEQPYTKSSKKTSNKALYRDTENSYVGGVSSGLGHYLEIEAIWIRLIWVVLTVASSGVFLFVYIAFWIFTPEAKTTAEKLSMRGEDVTISNIEKKIREGFDNVSEKVKNVDYQKYGNRAKAGAGTAATAFGSIVNIILKVIVAFVGIVILLTAGSGLIALFISLFTFGTFGVIEAPWNDELMMHISGTSIWVGAIFSFFAAGVPLFFLFILGLKILVKNLKSIGVTAKLVLLGLWILSVIGLAVIGVKEATSRAFDEEAMETYVIPTKAQDTLIVEMRNNTQYSSNFGWSSNDFELKYDENDNKVLYNEDIGLVIRSTKDSVAKLEIIKSAEGSSVLDAKKRAENIEYHFEFSKNTLYLDSYFLVKEDLKARDQEIDLVLWLPEQSFLMVDANTEQYHRNSYSSYDILQNGQEGYTLRVENNNSICLDCPVEVIEDEDVFDTEENIDEDDNFSDDDSELKEDEFDTSDDFDAPVPDKEEMN